MRVRFVKTDVEGMLRSTRTFNHPTNGGRYFVKLNTLDNSFEIVDDAAQKVVSSGVGGTPHGVKIMIRKELALLGLDNGEKEKRMRKKDVVQSE